MSNKRTELVIPVSVKMEVDESTAAGCLKIVEMFVNATGRNVIVEKKEDGRLEFNYEPAR